MGGQSSRIRIVSVNVTPFVGGRARCKSVLAPSSTHVNSRAAATTPFPQGTNAEPIVSELAQQQDSLPAGHWPKLNQGARKTSPQKPDICCSPIPRFCSFTP